jgi:hypothetical protein
MLKVHDEADIENRQKLTEALDSVRKVRSKVGVCHANFCQAPSLSTRLDEHNSPQIRLTMDQEYANLAFDIPYDAARLANRR